MMLKYRQIEAFKALMEAGTVSRAADLMLISQPAASKLIAAFEAAIPFRVFLREGGRLIPTPEAHALYSEVERMFSGVNELEQFAHTLADEKQGQLSIGVLPALSVGVIQRIVAEFLETRPNVRISLHTRTSMQTAGQILSRKIDIGIAASPPDFPNIFSTKLIDALAVCILPLGHPLAAKPVIRATDLHGQDFVSLTALDGSLQRVEASFLKDGIKPRIKIETPLSMTSCACVVAGMGLSIVDPFSPQSFAGKLHIRPYEPNVYFSFYSCMSTAASAASSLAVSFQDLIQRRLAGIHAELRDGYGD